MVYRRFSRAVNAAIALFAVGLAAIYLGRYVLDWLPTAGHLLVSVGFLIASVLFGLRASGRLGRYPTRTRAISTVGTASAASTAVLNVFVFVTPVVTSGAGRLILLVVFLAVMMVFFVALIPDLVSRRQ